jgi:glyoxylase-like metal-dependent hydrolase (beta-lactamase superfamily II)
MATSGEMVVRSFAGGAFAENGYLVSCVASGHAILVDPGAAVEEMLAAVREGELVVDSVVLTHAHVDHLEGVARAKRETNAPIYLHPDGVEFYRMAPMQARWFGVEIEALPPVDRSLAHGGQVEVGDCVLEVRYTPGHAPGHVILVGDGLALVGDCIFAGSIGRTDLPGGDFQLLIASIREQILTLPDETVLYPGHGQPTTVGHERASNPYLTPHFGGGRFA